MRILSALLISAGLLSGVAMADDSRYLCKSDDGRVMVRAFPGQLRATVVKFGTPSYDMDCTEGRDANTWMQCEGADTRTFILERGGRNGVYVGSMRTTPVRCYVAGGTLD